YINNAFAMETRQLYTEAYKIAASVIYKLNSVLSLQFPEDEVGFIALHIASNMEKLTMSEMNKINDLISKCIQIVEHDLHQS
ncbi:PRD domain-containing protein, partial [Paenibacillus xylanexedens]|uniref:PRD domain-containing protein n=1 Tax=Paenibacillus xylanexedens TaxID=528191 RepID=UPI0011A761E1